MATSSFASHCMLDTNALSELMEVRVLRDGFEHTQDYSRGAPISKLKKGGATRKHGTEIHFRPDPQIFGKSGQFEPERIRVVYNGFEGPAHPTPVRAEPTPPVRLLLAKTDSNKGTMPLRDELRIFLYQLDLGMTRRAALLAFAARCPAEPVESFVTAIIQAEEKGMSLRDVLRIQADVLRQKRIQDAIAYIDTANLHMMAPVMLIIVALMIVILAPVLLNMKSVMGGGVEGLP